MFPIAHPLWAHNCLIAVNYPIEMSAPDLMEHLEEDAANFLNEDTVSPWHSPYTFNPNDWIPIQPNNNNQNSASRHVRSTARTVVVPRAARLEEEEEDIPHYVLSEHIHNRNMNLYDDIMELQTEQDELLRQITLLEQAHQELDQARNDLMRVLLEMDDDPEFPIPQPEVHHMTFGSHRYRVSATGELTQIELEESDEDEDEDESDCDEYEDVENEADESDYPQFNNARFASRGLRISDRPPSRLGFIASNPYEIAFEEDNPIMFLDCDGNQCMGLEETLTRAVGWVDSSTMATIENDEIDKNGNIKITDIKLIERRMANLFSKNACDLDPIDR